MRIDNKFSYEYMGNPSVVEFVVWLASTDSNHSRENKESDTA